MITTTLSSRSTANKALFFQQVKFTLKRYFYGGVIYTILLLLLSVIPLYSQNYIYSIDSASSSAQIMFGGVEGLPLGLLLNYRSGGSIFVTMLVVYVPLLLSACLLGYLHNRRSVDFFHALPIPRETLFLSRFTAGMIFTLVPILFCQVLNLIAYFIFPVKIASIAILFSSFFLEILVISAAVFAIFSICFLVAVSCSTVIEQLGYSAALTIIGPVIVLMWFSVCNEALFGYVASEKVVQYLSPIGLILTTSSGKISMAGIISLIVWIIIGVGMLMLGLRIYKKRQSETAEQLGRVTILSRLVKVFAGTLGTFFITVLFSGLFHDREWVYIAGALIGAPLGYIIVEAITASGFSTVKKALPMIGLTTGVMLMAGSYLSFSGFGYEYYIPKTESINEAILDSAGSSMPSWNRYLEEDILKTTSYNQSGYLTNKISARSNSITLRTPEAIDKVRALHESIVYNREDPFQFGTSLEVNYKTKPFGNTARFYPMNKLQVKEFTTLIIDPELVQATHPAFSVIPEHIQSVSISDKLGKPMKVPPLDQSQIQQLLEAMRSDLLKQTIEGVTGTADNSNAAFIEFNLKDIFVVRDAGIRPLLTVENCSMLVQPSDTHTVTLLKEWKLWPNKPDYSKITKLEILCKNDTNSMISSEHQKPVPSEYNSLKSYDYWRTPVTDPELISAILEESSSISTGLTPKNLLEVSYNNNMSGTGVSFIELYIDNERLLEILNDTEIKAPYFLTIEEEALYRKLKDEQGFPFSDYYQYQEKSEWLVNSGSSESVKLGNYMDLEGKISVGTFFEKNFPELLASKSSAAKKAMYNTPIENEDGTLSFMSNSEKRLDGVYRSRG